MLLIFYTCNLVFFLIAPVTSREREGEGGRSERERVWERGWWGGKCKISQNKSSNKSYQVRTSFTFSLKQEGGSRESGRVHRCSFPATCCLLGGLIWPWWQCSSPILGGRGSSRPETMVPVRDMVSGTKLLSFYFYLLSCPCSLLF